MVFPSHEALLRYAATCNYAKHDYLMVQGNQLGTTPDKEKRSSIDDVVKKTLELLQCATPQKKPVILESLKIIRDNIYSKIQSLNIFYNRCKLQGVVSLFDNIIKREQKEPFIPNEEVFRLRFLASLPCDLKVQRAPSDNNQNVFKWADKSVDETTVDEWKFIEWLSAKIFESKAVQTLPPGKRFEQYYNMMLGAYKGDHLLIEDDIHHTQTQHLVKNGAIIRASSHYETGRPIKKWNFKGHPVHGGDKHADLLTSDIPHFGLTGQHIKHVLFHAVDLYEMNNQLIPGKTARQVERLVNSCGKAIINGIKVTKEDLAQSKIRHFVALQFEASPDTEGHNVRHPHFWRHRIAGFFTYRILKLTVGDEVANVGPYGFGRTDVKPVIIEKK